MIRPFRFRSLSTTHRVSICWSRMVIQARRRLISPSTPLSAGCPHPGSEGSRPCRAGGPGPENSSAQTPSPGSAVPPGRLAGVLWVQGVLQAAVCNGGTDRVRVRVPVSDDLDKMGIQLLVIHNLPHFPPLRSSRMWAALVVSGPHYTISCLWVTGEIVIFLPLSHRQLLNLLTARAAEPQFRGPAPLL